jgi:endonuclease/exonuclease/phosphatase (EEP) superfamily protein YafD
MKPLGGSTSHTGAGRLGQGDRDVQALMISATIPTPALGAAGRCPHLLTLLQAAGIEVEVVCRTGPGQHRSEAGQLHGLCQKVHVFDDPPRQRWTAFKTWFAQGCYTQALVRHDDMVARVARLLPHVELVIAADAVCDPAVLLGRDVFADFSPEHRPFHLLDLSEPLSARLRARGMASHYAASWLLRAEAMAVRRLEIEAVRRSNLVLVSNPVDLQLADADADGPTLWCVPSGVQALAEPELVDFKTLSDRILFCGDLNLPAHQRSAVWLAKLVMPQIRLKCPNAAVELVTPVLPRALRILRGMPGVTVREGVDAMAMARRQPPLLGVAPQRQARAAAELVLAMMAAGRPVVCTAEVAAMLPPAVAPAVEKAQSARQIAEQLLKLLSDRKRAYHRGIEARAAVASYASWGQPWHRVAALFGQLQRGERPKLESDARPVPGRKAAPTAPAAPFTLDNAADRARPQEALASA